MKQSDLHLSLSGSLTEKKGNKNEKRIDKALNNRKRKINHGFMCNVCFENFPSVQERENHFSEKGHQISKRCNSQEESKKSNNSFGNNKGIIMAY